MRRRAERQTLVMALALVGVGTAFARGIDGLAPVSEAFARAVAPVDGALRAASGLAAGLVGRLRDVESLRGEVARLERQVAELEVNSAKLGDLMRENERLRQLANFRRARIDLDLLGASIQGVTIAREPGGLIHAVWLDVGAEEGVSEGDPVTTNRGLVGRVVRVHGRASQVRLINDPAARVGVRIERSQATGILVGSPSGELAVRYLPRDVGGAPSVEVGDLVFTSGLADEAHYPRMVPVGQVVEVRQSDEKTSLEAVVRPHVDLGALDDVLVVTDWRPVAPAGDDAPAGAVEADPGAVGTP